MFQRNLERQSKHAFYVHRLLSKNRAVYEIMWNSTVEPGSSQMTTRRMRISCSISKATNLLSEYITLILYPVHEWLRERASLLRQKYVHGLSYYLTQFPVELSVMCGVPLPDVPLL